MSDDSAPFWMVIGSGPASHRHCSRREAETEAKRLARSNPDQWFYVTETISAHRKNDVESVNLRKRDGGVSDDGITFLAV